jgi:hypothetical protein
LHSTTANISTHWGPEYHAKVQDVIDRHSRLFRAELGCFTDVIDMPIPLKPDANLSRLRQTPYSLSRKDQEALDSILDPLRASGVVEPVPLGDPSPAASPAFVVYKDGKPRMVVDLRKVNAEIYVDAYPLLFAKEAVRRGSGGYFIMMHATTLIVVSSCCC